MAKSVEYGVSPIPTVEALPKTLYKYLSSERIGDVLECGQAKFTQMANTNDLFEVRKTFESLAGPRFLELIGGIKSTLVDDKNVERQIDQKIKERTEGKMSRHMRRKAVYLVRKQGLKDQFKRDMDVHTGLFTQYMNTEEASSAFFDMFGKDMLCYSTSDSCESSGLWAHYAESSRGFVLGLRSNHPWFCNKNDLTKTRLHKVTYIDGMVEEFLDNPEAAFGSKTTDWSYEREWRMYCGMEHIERTIGSGSDAIHLMSFPPDLVSSIIIGARATNNTISLVKTIAFNSYPFAELFMAKANSKSIHPARAAGVMISVRLP